MRLPAPKVANVARITNQRWPACRLRHDRVVNPDWKEDSRALLAFPCQGRFHFLLHPLTRYRRLGQHEQQLVIEADGLINAGADAVANFQVFRGKPAAHALVLEVRMEAFGEGVVLAGVANEAGIELEGLAEQRGQIVN